MNIQIEICVSIIWSSGTQPLPHTSITGVLVKTQTAGLNQQVQVGRSGWAGENAFLTSLQVRLLVPGPAHILGYTGNLGGKEFGLLISENGSFIQQQLQSFCPVQELWTALGPVKEKCHPTSASQVPRPSGETEAPRLVLRSCGDYGAIGFRTRDSMTQASVPPAPQFQTRPQRRPWRLWKHRPKVCGTEGSGLGGRSRVREERLARASWSVACSAGSCEWVEPRGRGPRAPGGRARNRSLVRARARGASSRE